jgi:hypothetical protein
MGLYPLHDDDKPSLSLNKEKGLWHCFSCNKGGNVRDFGEAYGAGFLKSASPIRYRGVSFNTFRGDRLEIASTKKLRYQVVRIFS